MFRQKNMSPPPSPLQSSRRGEKEDRKTGYWLLQQPSKKWWGFIWWQWEEERRHQGHCTGRADFLIGYVAASHHREKAMAPHSSTLAWRIPWMEEPSGLQSMGSLGVGHERDFTFTFHFHALEKEMATHSSVLAWRIPGTREPGGLLSMGSTQSRTRLKWLSSSSRETRGLPTNFLYQPS